MGIGTFGAFTQARLAIYASQAGIQVTGNNISNVNTAGYTRQRLNQSSLYANGYDRYVGPGTLNIGHGVIVNSVSQIRSPYLDIRFRQENAKVGYYDAQLSGLDRIAQILDEVGKGEEGFGVLGDELNAFFSAFADLIDQAGHQEYDNTVRSIATALTNKFHSYANQLQEVYDSTVAQLQEDVTKINSILTTIRELNDEIRKCDIHGDNALEMRDERNRQIDALSALIDIDVTYTMEQVAPGVEVEKLTIRLGNENPDGREHSDEAKLVDGIYCAQLKIQQVPKERWTAAELASLREKYPNDPQYWPYKTANGEMVMGQYHDDATNKDVNYKYWDSENETYTNDGTNEDGSLKDGMVPLTENKKNDEYKPYVMPSGEYTDDPNDALQVDNENFNMMLTKLVDRNGLVLKDTTTTKIQEGKTVTITDDDGNRTTAKIEDLFTADGSVSFTVTNKDGTKVTYTYTRTTKTVQHEDVPDTVEVTYTLKEETESIPTYLDDNDLYGEVQALRELLTEKGEFVNSDVLTTDSSANEDPYRVGDENAGIKRGIQYYQRALDLMANQLAKALNDANQGYRYDPEGNYIGYGSEKDNIQFVEIPNGTKPDGTANDPHVLNKNDIDEFTDDPLEKSDWQQFLEDMTGIPFNSKLNHGEGNAQEIINTYLSGKDKDGNTMPGGKEDEGNTVPLGIFDGGVLFSNNGNSDGTDNITASNISVSYTWQNNHILVKDFKCPVGETEPASSASDNLLHISYLADLQKMNFYANDLDETQFARDDLMFHGTFYEFWNNIGDTLGHDQTVDATMLDTHYTNALSIDTSRDSVSAVDFNDEAMNLMMYSKSYNAACRLMTTIDSMIDKLVNGTGMTT